ncbi:Imm8 family immunity protein [Rodentibacter caecimuris]|uniref:Imm8 family immunity protein n=1 Tax=Rodentibacter caecimuris TaxID=1796644 RepID=UPI00075188E3|nr:Imm8 family immunity protein [Rodentibacter heylii]
MRAKLKSIMEQVGEFDLEVYRPENEKLFCINVLLCIGPDDNTDSINYFDLKVCTLDWLYLYQKKTSVLRHVMIVDRYDFKQIISYINEIITQCYGDSWEDIANKLSRYFFWEYEDYS